MAESDPITDSGGAAPRYDAVVVGASLAGCTTAILLARAGARVALIEKRPSPTAFKRICSHFIQSSAVPTIERLGLLDPILAAGGLRTRVHAWTPWGWIEPSEEEGAYCLNLRRELLDPLLRATAEETPGVELRLGEEARRLLREDGANRGVVVRDAAGREAELRAPLTVGADGRDSQLAALAGVPERTRPNGRVAYGAYFEGAPPAQAPDTALWMLDPQWAAAFPTDSGLTFYAAMVTRDRLADFKRDGVAALTSFIADIPDPPPIGEARQVGPMLGKIEMPSHARVPTAPGLALVGDAALACDPLFGVGCGWAFQSGEWLADSVAPALRGEESLQRGLRRYRRRHRHRLRGHAWMIDDYSSGRRLRGGERALFATAARDRRTAAAFEGLATRRTGPARTLATTLPRVAAIRARRAITR